jgi:hypothetical protein
MKKRFVVLRERCFDQHKKRRKKQKQHRTRNEKQEID